MQRSRILLLAVLVLGASLLLVQASMAVGMATKEGMPGMMAVDKMQKALNLTPDQVSKIQAIQKDYRTQRDAIIADKSLSTDAKKTKLMDLHKSKQSQMMAVLTPDQRNKYKEQFSARRAEGFDTMTKALGLNATQQSQIKSIMDSRRTQLQAVHNDKSLSIDAKRAKVKEILTATRDKVRQVLTPEQRTKYDAMRGHMAK